MLGIQAQRSTNCQAAVVVSKPDQSGSVSTKVAIETPSASQRPRDARASPNAITASPPKTGSQTKVLSRCAWIIGAWSLGSQQEVREQGREPDDHREGVVVQVSRLGAAQ